jgi:predicted 3-demethylubiquinone-9 3-methyltransferase (glyoxalase superfamily)
MMGAQVRPFLMFTGEAEAAMTFYVSLFPDGAVRDIVRYGPGESGPDGTIKRASFAIGGQTIDCSDSPPVHDFTFTPSFSLFVECDADDELARLVAALAAGGTTLMPLDDYGFSRRFAWVSDRFGVSWQLNLP